MIDFYVFYHLSFLDSVFVEMPAVIREFTEEDLDENVILLVVEIGDKAVVGDGGT